MRKSLYLFAILLVIFGSVQAQSTTILKASNNSRDIISFDKSWQFNFQSAADKDNQKYVNLPHSWNALAPIEGKTDYLRTTGIYENNFYADRSLTNKRVFLYFYGANSVAYVYLNGNFVGKHIGGYTAFCFEISKYLEIGKSNSVKVEVSNAYRPDVFPLDPDFNIYGGLHRKVSFIVTSLNCITPLDYASPGVFIKEKKITNKLAELQITTKLSLQNQHAPLEIKTTIYNANNKIIKTNIAQINGSENNLIQNIEIKNPHLWDGIADPYLYMTKVELLQNHQPIDEVTQRIGLRYFKVDPNKGFFLNGKYLDLHGFGFHEDKAGIVSAYREADYDTDISLIKEAGGNALRFTHYPHGQRMYDLCDENGIVAWTEIPFVGGIPTDEAGKKNLEQMMIELIRQHYNHPSVMFWGLENEIHPSEKALNWMHAFDSIAHKEDDTRYTTIATNTDGSKLQNVSDVMAYNRYYGWYGGKFSALSDWADNTHKLYPNKSFALSEYGAGASIYQHAQNIQSVTPRSHFHPEEWQRDCHEAEWEILKSRPFIWAKFAWNFADFGAAKRNEGDHRGINDKGLVTYDRKIKKDAFYFYKANWNAVPMLYLTDKRFVLRTEATTEVKGYSTVGQIELFVNGKSMGVKTPDDIKRVIWENILLQKGENKILLKSINTSQRFEDSCEWVLQ